jgi:hypothetical protein
MQTGTTTTRGTSHVGQTAADVTALDLNADLWDALRKRTKPTGASPPRSPMTREGCLNSAWTATASPTAAAELVRKPPDLYASVPLHFDIGVDACCSTAAQWRSWQ